MLPHTLFNQRPIVALAAGLWRLALRNLFSLSAPPNRSRHRVMLRPVTTKALHLPHLINFFPHFMPSS
ncbi:MAG: hypothetical protein CL799_08275 [Chromatiales bacterium]|nr:hypothetical protein [Chromatiales bacterium]